jgi:hypothetical protein
MNMNNLLDNAFIDGQGSVHKMYKKYKDYVNVTSKPIDEMVIGIQYVKILFALEKLETGKDYDYYQKTSELRLENWIKANYKGSVECEEFNKHKRLRG